MLSLMATRTCDFPVSNDSYIETCDEHDLALILLKTIIHFIIQYDIHGRASASSDSIL